MTLAQFETTTAPSLEARQRIDDLDDQRKQAVADRGAADKVSAVKIQQVVAGVLADPTEGPDSALYGAFGYARESEQKTGLTRKRNKPPEDN